MSVYFNPWPSTLTQKTVEYRPGPSSLAQMTVQYGSRPSTFARPSTFTLLDCPLWTRLKSTIQFWNSVFLAVAFYFIRKYIQLIRNTSKKSESALLNGKSGHQTAYQSTVSTRPVSNVNSPPPLVEKNLGELTAFTTVLLQPKMSLNDS